jgi:D-alanyl-D-alanine carboxypeptidase/D-alanyl-D-alanine-endopeptidase (penicillin-binding protein 4)
MRPHRERSLAKRLDAVLERGPSRSTVAIHVRDLDDGRVLFDQRGGWHLNPASNQKIVTAHAAVELLGPDYRFETTLARSGDTLYLRGEGDPSLSLVELDGLLRDAHAKGELEGVRNLHIDDTAFDAKRFAPGVDEHAGEAAYLAPTGAVSLNFNTVEIIVRPGASKGAPAQVEVFPPSAAIEIVNEAHTGFGSLEIESGATTHGRTRIHVSGSITENGRKVVERRRIHDPSTFVGGALTELASTILGEVNWTVERGSMPEAARVLARHQSATLVDVLSASMKYSNNFTTEQVLRTLAWRATGHPGNWENGVSLLETFTERVAAVEDEVQLVNGSGLTHEGRLSPRMLVDLLSLSGQAGSPSEALLASYARAGGEGTLHYRNVGAGSRVRAKTGTLAGVSALSGVVFSNDGQRRIAFSMLVNGADAKDSRVTQDYAVQAMLAWLDAQG